MKNITSLDMINLFEYNKAFLNNISIALLYSNNFRIKLCQSLTGDETENQANMLVFLLSAINNDILPKDDDNLSHEETVDYIMKLRKKAKEAVYRSKEIQELTSSILKHTPEDFHC